MTLYTTFTAMDPTILAAFITAGILLNLTPGIDMVFVIASSISGGIRTGMAAATGISLGVLTHITLATIGVAALIAAHPSLFNVIRWAGIAYLIWLAIQAWRATDSRLQQTGARSATRAIKRGWITNILNPKVALFILAFLPQFTTPGAGPIWQQILILGLIFVFNGTLVSYAAAIMSGALANRLRRHQRLMNRISATLLAALAARMATT